MAEPLVVIGTCVVCPHGGGAACPDCVAMCAGRPCWGTPGDVRALLAAGYGPRLMDDYWVGSGGADGTDDIHLLSPAIVGYEGQYAPFIPLGRCTFLTQDGLCELHDLGLKPTEGRVSDCNPDVEQDGIHEAVAMTWNHTEEQAFVASWHTDRMES